MAENIARGRRGAGAQNRCMHAKAAIVEDILDWRPFESRALGQVQTLGPPPRGTYLGFRAAHSSKASSAGHIACPHCVSWYSTFGGTCG